MALEVGCTIFESVRPLTDAILFYDGTCGFCARSVQFILAHEGPDHGLRFATLQGKTAAGVRDGHPELNGVDSMVWYERATETRGERVLVRSSAALAAARYMGGVWRFLAAVAWWVPRPLRDGVYRVIARHRHRLVRNEMCLLPTEEQRVRFIE